MKDILLLHSLSWIFWTLFFKKIEIFKIFGLKKISLITIEFILKSTLFEFLIYCIYIPIMKEKFDFFMVEKVIIFCKLEIYDSILQKTDNNIEMNFLFKNLYFWSCFFFYNLIIFLSCIFVLEEDDPLRWIIHFSETINISLLQIYFSKPNYKELFFYKFRNKEKNKVI